MEAIDRLRTGFRQSSTLMKIVWVNVAVFVLLRLIAIVFVFSGRPDYIDMMLAQVELPSSPAVFLTRPWTLVTYMFAQYDLLHVVFNMLWLYWFGTMFTMTASSRRLLTLYLCGGLAGAVLFMLGYMVLPMFHSSYGSLIGSSASVIAVVTAVAILMPRFKMHLLLIGSVSVKWIAIVTIVLVLVGVTGSNAGGEIAHIGGVIAGVLYGLWIKRGHEFSFRRPAWRRAPADAPAPSQSSGSGLSADERALLDAILDKIKKSGYTSLTPSERERLFSVSRKIK
ncbi:MAG: rhomboid family intramembrane serine protease [Duncaniella sp.]|nr:rhomboid family intramembrane serine protease [Duncaniella sp.]